MFSLSLRGFSPGTPDSDLFICHFHNTIYRINLSEMPCPTDQGAGNTKHTDQEKLLEPSVPLSCKYMSYFKPDYTDMFLATF